MMQDFFAGELDLFHGSADPRQARIYARLPNVPGAKLTGVLRGPQSLLGTTLPTTIPFRDLGSGDTMLAEALLPDPCFWSPEMPALYTAHLELQQGHDCVASLDRTIGIRALGVKGRSFYDQGKRVVLRGASFQWPLSPDLLQWHDELATVLAVNPNEALCDEATRVGVRIVAQLQQPDHDIRAEVRRLGRHPSVQVIAVDANQQPEQVLIDKHLQQLAPNTVLARMHAFGSAGQRTGEAPEAHLVFTVQNEPSPEFLKSLPGAVMVWEGGDEYPNVALARGACDRVQAKFARVADFAGFFV